MSTLISVLYIGAAIAGGCVIAAPLSQWLPALELVNELRPLALVVTGILLVGSLSTGDRTLVTLTASGFIATLLLFLSPFLWAASRGKKETRFLRVLTFNIEVENKRYADVADFIAASGADIVCIQEIDNAVAEQLFHGVGKLYPHMFQRGRNKEVGLALFSKHSCVDVGHFERTDHAPAVIWAYIWHQEISYEFIGVYLAYPLHPRVQARHIKWLVKYVCSRSRPLIVIGDFNLTPFSAKLTKFAYATGLKRHATVLASWPAHKFWPAFLIDHVFSTRDFSSVKTTVGPYLGSDHRPIIADIGISKSSFL
jgi:endonuclease/exonuclease/phosphatase (EEP) superfamily protein YafD